MTSRLSADQLQNIPKNVQKPNYSRQNVSTGIVHLGIGAFHRAHQAVYVDDVLAQQPDWGILGVSLRRPDTRDALNPQDGLYTLAVRDASGTNCRIIGSISRVLQLSENRDAIMQALTDASTRIVSLTVTEKGYCFDPATGELAEGHADIVYDLQNPTQPISAPGLLVEAIARRQRAGIAPLTIMSCDNLPNNGQTCARIVTRFATLRDLELGDFVKQNVAFPSTMVDRIVPATTDDDRQDISELLGCEDAWPIVTEPFTQWVIEDHFPSGRPAFENVGAELVSDVEPFEKMKLRMLNGAHSTLAYLGYLSGHETVAQTVGNSAFKSFLFAMMTDEIMPTLNMPGTDLHAYRDALLARFLNPELKHRTWQIAMDGSQKLPQRLLDTIRDRIAAGQPYDRLALGVAAWMTYVAGSDESGATIKVKDPHAAQFAELAQQNSDLGEYVNSMLKIEAVFGTDLANNDAFAEVLKVHVVNLRQQGAVKTLMNLT